MNPLLFPPSDNHIEAGPKPRGSWTVKLSPPAPDAAQPEPAPVPQQDSPMLDLSSGRYLNEAAIRLHALRCSAQFRANRFTRVGNDFIDEVKADVEAVLRDLRTSQGTHGAPALPHEAYLTSGVLDSKLEDIFNDLIGRIIQNKVARQPSCGKTLGRTR